MRSTYITAIVIAILIALWFYSGGEEEVLITDSIADSNRENARLASDGPITRVQVQVSNASEQSQVVTLRGKTENKRTVEVKNELAGTIVERPVERGTQVKAGDLLCRISTEDRQVALLEAEATLNQARIEFDGAKKLKQKGFNSDAAIAAAQARLASAEANLNRRKLDLAKLNVRAPFGGFVDDVHQEIGDFVSPGTPCATIVDLNPMLLVGRVSELDVTALNVGQMAQGIMRDGTVVEGPVSFVGQTSDPSTRTYAVEIELDNADFALRSGITTEIKIPVASLLAQQVSPALFALDDAGAIGIRTIDDDNTVEFHLVEILADDKNGVWVTGLPNRASVIVMGQELVTPGETVDPVFIGQGEQPAQSSPDNQAPEAPPAQSQTDQPEAVALTGVGA